VLKERDILDKAKSIKKYVFNSKEWTTSNKLKFVLIIIHEMQQCI
jgi:hypothetical protein